MPVRFRKKIRKLRGHHTAGYGEKKKHRGKGSKGGKGWGGSTKHKRSFIYKYARDHFGYRGFRPPTSKPREVIINLDGVSTLAEKLGKDEIDLGKFGYTKLLGRGKLSKPLTIKVKCASTSAIEAVKKIGGNIILNEAVNDTSKNEARAG